MSQLYCLVVLQQCPLITDVYMIIVYLFQYKVLLLVVLHHE